MLLMQRRLRIVSGLKSEPLATKAKDVALVDAQPQEIVTNDNLNARVDAQVYFKVQGRRGERQEFPVPLSTTTRVRL
jgi:regulator of protease activity HflC (stomatin/prohibitin superfamily)